MVDLFFTSQVDTIAADKRWNKNANKKRNNEKDLNNLEVRSIGPLTKKGIYLAIQVSLEFTILHII